MRPKVFISGSTSKVMQEVGKSEKCGCLVFKQWPFFCPGHIKIFSGSQAGGNTIVVKQKVLLHNVC